MNGVTSAKQHPGVPACCRRFLQAARHLLAQLQAAATGELTGQPSLQDPQRRLRVRQAGTPAVRSYPPDSR
jgi:hypothetical protein